MLDLDPSLQGEFESFESWQVFKNQISKGIRQAITRICVEQEQCPQRVSRPILADFWPVNKISFFGETSLELWTNSHLISAKVQRLLEEGNKPSEQEVSVSEEGFTTGTESIDLSSREDYDNNNPFIRSAKFVEKPDQFPEQENTGPLFGRESEMGLLYRQVIDEDKLENQNIQQFFKLGKKALAKHLLLLFTSHIDSLILLFGPEKSLKNLLPLYFTILNVNSIYHCNFMNVNLDKKPVTLISFPFNRIN